MVASIVLFELSIALLDATLKKGKNRLPLKIAGFFDRV